MRRMLAWCAALFLALTAIGACAEADLLTAPAEDAVAEVEIDLAPAEGTAEAALPSYAGAEAPEKPTVAGNGSETIRTETGNFDVEDGVLVSYWGNSHADTIIIPDGIVGIGDHAFYKRFTSASTVVIPDTVTSIGKEVFGYNYFEYLVIPDSVTQIGEGAFAYCDKLADIRLPAGLTVIPEKMCAGCKLLKAIAIPNGVTRIGAEAFANTSLEQLSLPKGLTSIGDMAFINCDFTRVSFPESLTELGTAAFKETDLTKIQIPGGVREIGAFAFYNCDALARVTLDAGVTAIGEGAFWGCGALASVTIPATVQTIGEKAFYCCSGLKRLTLPSGLKTISDKAFYGCSALEAVSLPDTLTVIGDSAFEDCRALEALTLPKGLKSIGSCAFKACGLKSLVIPDGLTSFGKMAFNCGLESITIPGSVKRIPEDAFADASLRTIVLEEGVAEIGTAAFSGNGYLQDLYIPASVKLIQWLPGETYYKYNADGTVRETWVIDRSKQITIHGKTGSSAERYAGQYGFRFVATDVKPEPTVAPPTSLAGAKISGLKDLKYNGKVRKPAVTVKLDGKTLKKGTDYKVSYTNNKAIGKATVTVTGIGGYTGKATATFRINPKKVSGLKLTAGAKKLTVTWTKASGVSGYQIQYSLNKSFSSAKTQSAKKNATKVSLKNLKSKRTYYVRIRGYKTVNKVKYRSAWSAAVKARVK